MEKHKPHSVDEVTEKIGNDSKVDVVVLENMILNDFNMKIDLGREIEKIIIKHKIPSISLRNEFVEALKVFKNYRGDEGCMVGISSCLDNEKMEALQLFETNEEDIDKWNSDKLYFYSDSE